ncbi:hypothetical protein IOC57_06470 [Bacillus sp. SD075]|uniref:hypothetical protein n=1 Tax=Bacillus sp. SD075 TaxID=2781732 RepID=UPI001A96A38B|nr:hypothetical protein [Bacillus sp. SD075]MBO0997396.1 hypothetical protein [Bacillus sp. SD075]
MEQTIKAMQENVKSMQDGVKVLIELNNEMKIEKQKEMNLYDEILECLNKLRGGDK